MVNRLVVIIFVGCLASFNVDRGIAQEHVVEISLENHGNEKTSTIFVDHAVTGTFLNAISRSLQDAGYDNIQIESAVHARLISPERSPKQVNLRVHFAQHKLTLTLESVRDNKLVEALITTFSETLTVDRVRLKEFPVTNQRYNMRELLKMER